MKMTEWLLLKVQPGTLRIWSSFSNIFKIKMSGHSFFILLLFCRVYPRKVEEQRKSHNRV